MWESHYTLIRLIYHFSKWMQFVFCGLRASVNYLIGQLWKLLRVKVDASEFTMKTMNEMWMSLSFAQCNVKVRESIDKLGVSTFDPSSESRQRIQFTIWVSYQTFGGLQTKKTPFGEILKLSSVTNVSTRSVWPSGARAARPGRNIQVFSSRYIFYKTALQ